MVSNFKACMQSPDLMLEFDTIICVYQLMGHPEFLTCRWSAPVKNSKNQNQVHGESHHKEQTGYCLFSRTPRICCQANETYFYILKMMKVEWLSKHPSSQIKLNVGVLL